MGKFVLRLFVRACVRLTFLKIKINKKDKDG